MKSKRSAPKEEPNLVAEARGILAAALADQKVALEKLGKRLRNSKAREHDRDSWSHHAWLAKQVSQIMGELRKLEQSELAGARTLTPRQVVDYLRQCEPNERTRIVQQVMAMDDESGVL